MSERIHDSAGVPSCCVPDLSTQAGTELHRGDKTRRHRLMAEKTGGADTMVARSQTDRPGRNGRLAHEMVALEGGRFLMGTDDDEGFSADGEGPVREVTLSPFSIDVYSVTNEEYQRFIDATGYITEAEQFGWSFVFKNQVSKRLYKKGLVHKVAGLAWWLGVDGACWSLPEGPGSSIRDRMDHPVVHVSWADATAYSIWSGARLPTEAEWEYAARGGLIQAKYAWGNELTPDRKHRCNIWQGTFPDVNTAEDGWEATCPVDAYEPNDFGLYNVAGNVWEWCADWFHPGYRRRRERTDPTGPPNGTTRVMRGGSFLCHKSYCNRYRVAARTSNTPDSATTNLGFRCARSCSHM
jgi:formylglycine-generating enzyme